MPGILGTAAKGSRIFGIFVVGLVVALFVAPSALGVVTGAVGVALPPDALLGICALAGLFVMGWLA